MNMPARRVTAIVPLHDGASCIGMCLDALVAGDDAFEILVVDDHSSDDGAAIVEARALESGGRVRLVRLDRRCGFAGAVNRGVEALLAGADGSSEKEPPDLLVLVNQDCVVSPGWLEPLVRALDDERVAIAGSRLL
jgi:GT2 family glycosyltransferase